MPLLMPHPVHSPPPSLHVPPPPPSPSHPTPLTPRPGAQDSRLPPQFRPDPAKWRTAKPKDALLADPEADDDAYGEYYPAMAGFAGGCG